MENLNKYLVDFRKYQKIRYLNKTNTNITTSYLLQFLVYYTQYCCCI